MDSAQQPPTDVPENPQAGSPESVPASGQSAPVPEQQPQYAPQPQQYPPVPLGWQQRYLVPGEIEVAGQRMIPAGFGWRFLAFLIDALVLGILWQILVVAGGIPQPDYQMAVTAIGKLLSGNYDPRALESLTPPWYQAVLQYLMYGSYFTLFHAYNGASLGKQALGLQVRNTDGSPLNLLTALLRYIGYFFAAKLIYTAWWMSFDSRHRTLYDVLLGTNVFKAAGTEPSVYSQPH